MDYLVKVLNDLVKALNSVSGQLRKGLLPLVNFVLLVALVFPLYQVAGSLAANYGAVSVSVQPVLYLLVCFWFLKDLK